MRYWFVSLLLAVMVATLGNTQEIKKTPKDPEKTTKDLPSSTIAEIAGKGFDQWAKDIKSKDPSKREVAMKTILNFGPEKAYLVVPEIIKQLEKHTLNYPVDLSVRVNGTLVLSTVFKHYFEQKKEIDPKYLKESVAIFRTSIKDKQAILKIRTLQALPYLGPVAREALPDVVDTINDPTTWEARQVAIQTLVIVSGYEGQAPLPAKAMDALLRVLKDASAIVRHAGLQAIPYVGYNMKDLKLKSQLIAEMSGMTQNPDEDNTVRIQAHLSLILFKYKVTRDALDPVAEKEHLQPIEKMTKNYDPTTRLHALQAIASLGPAAKSAMPAVIEAIDDADLNIGVNAMVTLVHLRAYSAIPKLTKIKNDKTVNEIVRQAAEDTIDQLVEDEKMSNEEKKKADKKGDKK